MKLKTIIPFPASKLFNGDAREWPQGMYGNAINQAVVIVANGQAVAISDNRVFTAFDLRDGYHRLAIGTHTTLVAL